MNLQPVGVKASAVRVPIKIESTVLSRREENLVASGNPGDFVTLNEGAPEGGLTVTIHGINAGPEILQPVHEQAERQGDTVATYLYDDQRQRLTTTSVEFARDLKELRRRHAGKPLKIVAHSMGGRITLDALRQLKAEGENGKMRAELLAPPLAGFKSANLAALAPTPLARLISGVQPGKDMGTESNFQKNLESMSGSEDWQVGFHYGAQDHLVDHRAPSANRLAIRLEAETTLTQGADHNSIIQSFAKTGPGRPFQPKVEPIGQQRPEFESHARK